MTFEDGVLLALAVAVTGGGVFACWSSWHLVREAERDLREALMMDARRSVLIVGMGQVRSEWMRFWSQVGLTLAGIASVFASFVDEVPGFVRFVVRVALLAAIMLIYSGSGVDARTRRDALAALRREAGGEGGTDV